MSEGAKNSDLFPSLPLPKPHDGESLYSWCARFHQLSCNTSARKTSRQLFGHPSSGMHSDFPTPIGDLHTKSSDQLGTLEDLVFRRTLFGFYRPFLPESRATMLASAIEAGGYQKVHQALGLAASLPNCSGLLKVCPSCMQEDFAHYPINWWRIEHQWPAMFICQHHQQPLIYASASISEQSSKRWILPCHITDQKEWLKPPVATPEMLSRMRKISKWCLSIAYESDIHLDTSKLRYSYLLKAKEHGYMAMDGSLRLAQFRDDFLTWMGRLSNWPGLSFVKEVQEINAGFIGQLMRHYPGIRHPLKHLLMMSYLFPETDTFFAQYQGVSEIYDASGECGIKKKLTNIRHELVKLVDNEHLSVNSASTKLGISVTQAARFLNKIDIPYQHRPRIVGTEKEKTLVLALRNGKERAEICRELSIRKSYIKDYLAKNPNIRDKWEKARKKKLVTKYRKNFLSLLNANAGVPVKKLKQIPGNGIQWLQRNDRQWLKDNLPCLRC